MEQPGGRTTPRQKRGVFDEEEQINFRFPLGIASGGCCVGRASIQFWIATVTISSAKLKTKGYSTRLGRARRSGSSGTDGSGQRQNVWPCGAVVASFASNRTPAQPLPHNGRRLNIKTQSRPDERGSIRHFAWKITSTFILAGNTRPRLMTEAYYGGGWYNVALAIDGRRSTLAIKRPVAVRALFRGSLAST